VVFCVPSARPLQNGPANSVIAVDSNPLSSTAITDAITMHASAISEFR
jgi:phosphopantothenate synthetase